MLALCAATAVGIGQIALGYEGMPETIASHFDANGKPDGWSSREGFATMMIALHLFVATVFGFIGSILPRIPDSLINVPHKDIWLAPERRAESLTWMTNRLAWMGAVVQALFCAVTQLSLRASGNAEKAMAPWTHWALLAGFFAFMGFWLVGFFRRFRRPRP